METLYSSVGQNNVRQITVDFSCEFKHLQRPEWAGQEPKKWHCMTSEESKTSQGCGVDLIYFCWQNGKIYFMKCSNDDCCFIFPSSVQAEVCPSSPLTSVWRIPQVHSGLPLVEFLLAGVSVICKSTASCLREHREFSIIQILQAKKLNFKQAFPVQTSGISFFCACITLKVLHTATEAIVPNYFATRTVWKVTWVRQLASFALESNQT